MTTTGTTMSSATPCFPHLILEGLARHLSKLRHATTTFPSVPLASLQWTAPQGLQDALDLLVTSGDRVRDTATKFSLVLSSTTGGPGIKAISDEMRGACDSLVGALGVLVEPVAGAGPPLMSIYAQQVRAILRATEELIKHITSPGSGLITSTRPKDTAATELAPRTGVVWAACEQLGKLPRSNKVAYRRAILQHQGAVSDTLREFQAMLDEAEGTDDEDVDGVAQGLEDVVLDGGDDGYDDDDFFGGGDSLKAWERENVSRCLVALGHCSALLKGSLEAIDEATATAAHSAQEPEGSGVSTEVMEAVAGIEESCQGLAAAVVNAADALYPPQIRQELESQLSALVEAAAHTSAAVARLPTGPAVSRCREAEERVKDASSVGLAHGTTSEPEEGQEGGGGGGGGEEENEEPSS